MVVHRMKTLRVRLLPLLLFLVVLVNGCVSPFETHANARLNELDSLLSTVPIMPGSVIVKRYENINRSHVPRCATVSIEQVLGTNEAALQDVVGWYRANLGSNQWQINSARTEGATYVYLENKQVSLEISDNYRWFPEMRDAVKQGQESFQTLFYIGINTFVNPDASRTDCT